jgi:hypothetical protein
MAGIAYVLVSFIPDLTFGGANSGGGKDGNGDGANYT